MLDGHPVTLAVEAQAGIFGGWVVALETDSNSNVVPGSRKKLTGHVELVEINE